MKASDYRRQFDAELQRSATKKAASAQRAQRDESVDDLLAELTNRRYGATRRIDAIVRAGARAVKRPRLMNTMILIVAEPTRTARYGAPRCRSSRPELVQDRRVPALRLRLQGCAPGHRH